MALVFADDSIFEFDETRGPAVKGRGNNLIESSVLYYSEVSIENGVWLFSLSVCYTSINRIL